ncbi:MAG: hypothetical protein IIC31_10955 [Chloroflexi bacterium]|nr:hypothetical protein [Chloroflexota bacterium]
MTGTSTKPGELRFGMAGLGVASTQILPAIATENWTLETIDDHIAEVRGVYLRSLGHPSAATVQRIETVEPTH